jgi:hypothetical protein
LLDLQLNGAGDFADFDVDNSDLHGLMHASDEKVKVQS